MFSRRICLGSPSQMAEGGPEINIVEWVPLQGLWCHVIWLGVASASGSKELKRQQAEPLHIPPTPTQVDSPPLSFPFYGISNTFCGDLQY